MVRVDKGNMDKDKVDSTFPDGPGLGHEKGEGMEDRNKVVDNKDSMEGGNSRGIGGWVLIHSFFHENVHGMVDQPYGVRRVNLQLDGFLA